MSEHPYVEYMQRARERNPLATCPTCGKKFQKNSGNHKYCNECGSPTRANRFVIFRRDKFQCAYCGDKSYEGAELHLDHVIPKHEGGEGKAYNLITACKECNLSKNKTLLDTEIEDSILAEIARRNAENNIEPHTRIVHD